MNSMHKHGTVQARNEACAVPALPGWMVSVTRADEIPLRGRLTGRQRVRLESLMDMMYRPKEFPEEVGFEPRQVYRVYIPAGCPHVRDERGHLWSSGAAFRFWALDVYRRHRLQVNEAFCLTCKRAVEIVDSENHKKDGLVYLTCECPGCGRVLAKITAKYRE